MITLHNYSEKAFAVTGETKPIKDQLKASNARFNPYLSVGAGWIFSKSKQAQLLSKLQATGKTQFTVNEFISLLG